MRDIQILILGLVLAITALSSSSCKTSKQVVEQVVPRSLSEVIDSISGKSNTYDFFYGKAKMKYNGAESRLGGRMTVMMIPDSVLWMNFKKLSIEGARVLIRPDSTWILYRLDGLYEADYTQAYLDFYKINLSFDFLQDMMVGNYYVPEVEQVSGYHEDHYYRIAFEHELGEVRYLIDNNMNLSEIHINDVQGRTFVMRISDYRDDGFGLRRDIYVEDIDSSQSHIAIKFSRATFDEPRSIKFEVPDHYRKLP